MTLTVTEEKVKIIVDSVKEVWQKGGNELAFEYLKTLRSLYGYANKNQELIVTINNPLGNKDWDEMAD